MTVSWWNKLTPSKRAICNFACLSMLFGYISVAPSGAQRPPEADTLTNPFAGDSAAVSAGKELYEQACQSCHGSEATGDRGPALSTGNFSHGSADGDLFHSIQAGIPGTQMPAFSSLPADSVWQMIAYLRSLSGKMAAQNETVPGNAAAGEDIFWGKGGCGACHEVNGRGSVVGPELSAAGVSAASGSRSIVASGYWAPNWAIIAGASSGGTRQNSRTVLSNEANVNVMGSRARFAWCMAARTCSTYCGPRSLSAGTLTERSTEGEYHKQAGCLLQAGFS